MKHLFFIAVLSLIAIFLHGYQFAVSDQAIFIPYINKYLDNSLYPGDPLFAQSSAQTSFFYPVLAQLVKFIDIQKVFFAGFVVFQFFFFHALYKLSKIILGDRKLSYFSLIPFFLPKFIAGTSIQTFDLYFGYRSIGIVFLLYFLSFVVEKRFYLASLTAAIGFWIHPLSIIPTIAILPFVVGFTTREKILKVLKVLSVALLLLLPYFLFNVYQSKNVFPLSNAFDPFWLEIIRGRDQYIFPLNWNLIEWLAVAFYLGVIVFFIKRISKSVSRIIVTVVLVGLVTFVFNLFFLEVLKTPLIAQFQLVRSIVPLSYMVLVMTPLFFTFNNVLLRVAGFIVFLSLSLNKYDILVYSIAVFILLFLIIKRRDFVIPRPWVFGFSLGIFCLMYFISNFHSFLNINQKYQIPKPYNPWIDVQLWAKSNTDISERFLVLPRQIGFRVFSKRSIVSDVKDGAVVMYSPTYAMIWNEIATDFAKFYELSEEDFQSLKVKHKFTYIVTVNTHLLKFPIRYKNDYFVVYKI